MRRLARRFATGAAALVLAGGTSYAQPPLPVSIAVVKQVMLSPTMGAPGTVVAPNDAHIAADVEGKVVWVARVGDVLKAGDAVARLDDALMKLQYASDAATVDRLRAALGYDSAQATRMEKLADAKAIAASARDEAVSTRDQDKAQLNGAIADLAKSRYNVEHSVIKAPFPGRVAARLINPGEYATVGKDLIRLVDIDDVEVSVPVPIAACRYLHPGSVLTMDIEGKAVEGKLRAVVPVGDINSRTVEVRLTLPAANGVVGDSVRVLVPSAPPRLVLAVPSDALVLREDNTYLFRVNASDVVEHVAVETGTEDGALVEIRGGVSAGDRVVVNGAERLQSGETVRPTNQNLPAR
jgi:RND family efflux transporter MFP subunit